jgi:ATP-dependent RNA helicase DeaD
VELAEQLEKRGFAVEALNGDIPQPQRERTIARVKTGQVDIVVATDVAARGLDIERLSHVVNFDMPNDPESYVHRIGRTGRAGRSGEAILFVAPRERSVLRVIERITRQSIEPMQLPSVADVNRQRIARFSQRITAALAAGGAEQFQGLIEQYQREHHVPAVTIAAVLASLLQGKSPLLLGGQYSDAQPRDIERPAVAAEPVRQLREFEPRLAPARPAKKERGARVRRREARALARATEARKSPPSNLVSRNAFALAGRNADG